jgi:hypothetical protein
MTRTGLRLCTAAAKICVAALLVLLNQEAIPYSAPEKPFSIKELFDVQNS